MMLRRILTILTAVSAIVALTAIVLWAIERFPVSRQLRGGFIALDTIARWQCWFLGWAPALLILLVILRRGRAIYLAALVAILTASLYAPFFFITFTRLDRVRGEVEELPPGARALAVSVVLSIGLALVYGAVAKRLVPLVILCAVLLPLFFVVMVIPFTSDWYAEDWERPDLLIAFRPCRGATLWRGDGGSIALREIDDVWERFADPRRGVTRAISGAGWSTNDYFWLTEDEAKQFRLRADDPKVVECDSRARRELVHPAAWHKVGFSD